jgi:methionine synthase II (cobalamin-independent)
MIYSTDRILTTHAGSLPRPEGLLELVLARTRGEPIDQAALARCLASAVAEVVRQQIECGLDIVNDDGPNSRRWPKARGVQRKFYGAGLS